ncbi:hypothetical protein [Mesorhizobium sp. ORS 3428]|uniref:hypothetical protein n=1 Tax=Mesorhizobium sp. ORS 3428 TaxID=540997 RepID=UPI001FCCD55C|nr:hypothetical protein [Mesorhizobium sp. ORS 3428]
MADAAFIGRLLHQRVVEQSAAELREAGGGGTLHDIGIEAVESADNYAVHRPALRRVRVNVVIVLEIVAVFGAADQRGGCVPFIGGTGLLADEDGDRQYRCEKRHRCEKCRGAASRHAFSTSRIVFSGNLDHLTPVKTAAAAFVAAYAAS